MNTYRRFAGALCRPLGVACITILSACGGGGGGGSGSSTPSLPSGVKIQSLSLTSVTTSAGVKHINDGVGKLGRFLVPDDVVKIGTTLYVADYGTSLIRRVNTTTNAVDTFAGQSYTTTSLDGTGTAAKFKALGGMVADLANAYLYVVDSNCIRKIDVSTGAVTTVAGSNADSGSSGNTNATGTAARFNAPEGLAIDSTYLYIADSGNHTVRRMNLTTTAVDTLAGTGTAGFANNGTGTSAQFDTPWRLAIDVAGATLYVAESAKHRVRAINTGSTTVTTLAGAEDGTSGSTDGTGTGARLGYPSALAVLGAYVYVGEMANGTIRRIDKSSKVTSTIAGQLYTTDIADGTGTSAHIWWPRGMTADTSTGDLYFTDDATVRKINVSTSYAVTTLAGVKFLADGTGSDADFSNLYALTSDGTYVYATDSSGHNIRKINPSTGATTTLAGGAYSGTSGYANATGRTARFYGPTGITTDGANLYVSDTKNHVIRKIVISTGAVSLFCGTPNTAGSTNGACASASFDNPSTLTYDGTYLYVADTANANRIRKINVASGTTSTLIATGTIGTVGGMAYTGSAMYFSQYAGHYLQNVNISTGSTTVVAGSGLGSSGFVNGTGTTARFFTPIDITTDGSLVYVADRDNHAIRVFNTSSALVSTLSGTSTSSYVDGSLANARFQNLAAIVNTGTSLMVIDQDQQVLRSIR